jgi:succinyl-CoA synthetase beta subunit
MLNPEMLAIIEAARADGWVMEPEAKRLFQLAGLPMPRFSWVRDSEGVATAADEIGWPVAVKVVSPKIVHKSDVSGVAVNLVNTAEVVAFFDRMNGLPGFSGILIEGMAAGVELIAGARIDFQFGPTVLLGIGGTGVEIYRDATVRMAPLTADDVMSMIDSLTGAPLLRGHRGSKPVDFARLTQVLLDFSRLVVDLAPYIESIDINPLFCSEKSCLIADARIMLKGDGSSPTVSEGDPND